MVTAHPWTHVCYVLSPQTPNKNGKALMQQSWKFSARRSPTWARPHHRAQLMHQSFLCSLLFLFSLWLLWLCSLCPAMAVVSSQSSFLLLSAHYLILSQRGPGNVLLSLSSTALHPLPPPRRQKQNKRIMNQTFPFSLCPLLPPLIFYAGQFLSFPSCLLGTWPAQFPCAQHPGESGRLLSVSAGVQRRVRLIGLLWPLPPLPPHACERLGLVTPGHRIKPSEMNSSPARGSCGFRKATGQLSGRKTVYRGPFSMRSARPAQDVMCVQLTRGWKRVLGEHCSVLALILHSFIGIARMPTFTHSMGFILAVGQDGTKLCP